MPVNLNLNTVNVSVLAPEFRYSLFIVITLLSVYINLHRRMTVVDGGGREGTYPPPPKKKNRENIFRAIIT